MTDEGERPPRAVRGESKGSSLGLAGEIVFHGPERKQKRSLARIESPAPAPEAGALALDVDPKGDAQTRRGTPTQRPEGGRPYKCALL